MELSPELVKRYEELRSQALKEATAVATPMGMALFLQKGTAAWMFAWSSSPEVPEAKGSKEPLPDVLRSELAMLLAGMFLNRRSEDEPPKGKPFSPSAQRLPLHQAINA